MEDEIEYLPNRTPESPAPTIPGRNGGTLKPFQPGQSGNPEGMKVGTIHFSTLMRRLLTEDTVVEYNGKPITLTRAEAIVLEKLRLALESESDAIRLRAIMDIEDRLEGRPVPVLPPAPEGDDEAVIFYIPNEHSRKRKT